MVAVTADKVVVELEARLDNYNRRIDASRQKFSSNMDAIRRSSRRAESSVDHNFKEMSSAIAAIEGPLGGVAGRFRSFNTLIKESGAATAVAALGFGALAVGASQVGDLADKYTRFENRLKTAGVAAENMARVQDRLFDVANKNGVEIEALGSVYARASLAANELGANQNKLNIFVGAVADALRVQGSSAEQSRGALLQLSQSLGQDIVRAEEFNSILEGALPIAQAAARGITRFKGSVADLRTAIINGEVTSREFFEGIIHDAPELARQAAKANLTLENSFTSLYNQLARGIGQTNNSLGATEKLSEGILFLADNLGTLGDALTVITAAVGSRLVAGLISAGTAQAKFYAGVATGNTVLIGGARAAEQMALAEKEAAAAALEFARAEQVKTAAVVKSVQAEIAANKAFHNNLVGVNSSTPAGVEVQARRMQRQVELSRDMAGANALLAKSNDALAAAELRATEATTAHAAALGRTTLAARAASVAQRAYAALSGVLGGPLGIGLTALAGTYLIVSSRTTAAADRTRTLQDELRSLGYLAPETSKKIDGIADSIDSLADDQKRTKIRETKESLDDLTDSHGLENFFATLVGVDPTVGLGDIEKSAQALSRQFEKLDPDLAEAAEKISNLADETKQGGLTAEEFTNQLSKISTKKPNEQLDLLIGKLREIAPTVIAGQKALQDFNKSLFEGIDTTPNQGGPNPGSRGYGAQKRQKTRNFLNSRSLGADARALDARTKSVLAAAKAAGILLSKEQAVAQARKELTFEANERASKKDNTKIQTQADKDAEIVRDLQEKIAAFGNARDEAIRAAADRFGKNSDPAKIEEAKKLAAQLYDMAAFSTQARDEAIQGYKDESAQIGVVGGALVELQYKQERYNKLRADGIPITTEIINGINQEAVAVRNVYEESERANRPLQNQVDIADQLRKSFVDVGISAVDGFDGIADAAVSALKQVAQLILQLYVLKPLTESLLGPAGSTIGGSIGSLLGYDEGGYTGPGGKKKPAGIVHKGEVVFSQDDVRRHGGPAAVEAIRRGLPGYENGGPVAMPRMVPMPGSIRSGGGVGSVTINTNVNIEQGQAQTSVRGGPANAGRELANMIEQSVKGIMQREKRQGGILWNPGAR